SSSAYADHPFPPPFPTRRSSDLPCRRLEGRLRHAMERGYPEPRSREWECDAPCTGCHRCLGGHQRHIREVLHGRRKKLSPHNRSDRKSTRLNSSHVKISYAVFSL